MTTADKVFRFYDFEFSTRRQELRKGDHRVRMSASQIRLLILFLERHGDLVTREEVVDRLWTDTATIDVTGGVNTAIKRLRENLGDNSLSPRFLETVIGLGYRFIAPVEEIQTEVQAEAPAAAKPAPATATITGEVSEAETVEPETPQETNIPAPATHREHWPRHHASRWWILMGACAVLIVAGVAALLHFQRRPPARAPEPANSENVFSRVTSNRGGKLITAAALSPDGQYLACADRSGIRIQTLATQQTAFLAPLPASEVTHIAWFPNEIRLAISGRDATTNRRMVWMVASSGTYTAVIAANAEMATVSPDGNTIAFTRSDGAEVWIASLDGMNLRRLVAADPGSAFSFLLWSPDGRRLMLASHSREAEPNHTKPHDSNQSVTPESPDGVNAPQQAHWMWESVDAATGKLLAREDNIRIDSAVTSPEGKLQYLTSPRTSLVQQKIMSVQTDPATGRFLGVPVSEASPPVYSNSEISASRDGSRVGIIGSIITADVFTASLHRDRPQSMPSLVNVHRLTSELVDSFPHAWASNGMVVYENNSQGRLVTLELQNQEASPTLVAQLPDQGASMAQISPDGKWVVFLGSEKESASVYRVRAGGGTPGLVPGTAGVAEVRCARTGPVGCVLHKMENKDGTRERLYFALDPVQGVGKLLASTPWEPARRGDWGLSPDGETIVVASNEALHPALKFLKLNGAKDYEKALPLQGHGAPLTASWTPNGKALFVETQTESGFELLYVTLDGKVQVLRKAPSLIWAISSPDGTQIAFPDYTVNTNVWVSDVQAKTP